MIKTLVCKQCASILALSRPGIEEFGNGEGVLFRWVWNIDRCMKRPRFDQVHAILSIVTMFSKGNSLKFSELEYLFIVNGGESLWNSTKRFVVYVCIFFFFFGLDRAQSTIVGVSNGLCEHLRACEQWFIFASTSSWQIFLASSEHFQNYK